MAELESVLRFVGHSGKRIVVAVLGAVLVLAGLVMLAAPGPGLLVIIAGLALLGTEFWWARRALDTVKRRAQWARERAWRRHNGMPPPAGG